ncbi:MAG TPA: TetR/AcrR family transcriptional regulator [Stellaceae bacterium]|nr:TetR/AcrR family transcriptional regulator [Stellaceae bacterium]
MPYSPEHKRDTRARILESARRLFNRKGFAETSIDEIMTEAGLTHGGFYRHFAGKDELYAAAVRQFLCKPEPAPWQAKYAALRADKPRARRIVDAYLSHEHFDDRDGCCPLLAMASDVSRSGAAVKSAYQEVAETLVDVFAANLGDARARERALVLAALCVGSMILARGVDDPRLADELRRAAHKHVLEVAGWQGGRRA